MGRRLAGLVLGAVAPSLWGQGCGGPALPYQSLPFAETFGGGFKVATAPFQWLDPLSCAPTVLACPTIDDPENQLPKPPAAPNGETWGTFRSAGYAPVWSAVGGKLTVRADYGASDQGYAFLTLRPFDRRKWLVGKATVTLSSITSANAYVGLAWIGTEADYREVGLQSDAPGRFRPMRLGPCQGTDLKAGPTDAVSYFGLNTPVRLRLEYRGSDGTWRYFLDGHQYRYWTGDPDPVEPANNLRAPLAVDPRLGLYWTVMAPGTVTGTVQDVQALELKPLVPKVISTSSTYAGSTPGQAFDGNPATLWNSGAFPTGWIELNLGRSASVKKIRLLPAQSPATAPTTHQVYVGDTQAPTFKAWQQSADTTDGKWIELDFVDHPLQGQFVRIQTTAGPSWVAWREIEIYE